MVYDMEQCKNCCSIMRECRRKNAELGGGWRCLGGEAPIPKLAAHWNLEPGGVVCVSAAFGSPTRTFRPLGGLSFFGFGCYKDCAPDGAGRGHWGCCARPLNRRIADCTLQIADWGADQLRIANCGSPNVEAGCGGGTTKDE